MLDIQLLRADVDGVAKRLALRGIALDTERFARLDPEDVHAVLVAEHGPFTWGIDPDAAVVAAAVLERIARMASETLRIEPNPRPIQKELIDRHFRRKHGPDAYYGQE